MKWVGKKRLLALVSGGRLLWKYPRYRLIALSFNHVPSRRLLTVEKSREAFWVITLFFLERLL